MISLRHTFSQTGSSALRAQHFSDCTALLHPNFASDCCNCAKRIHTSRYHWGSTEKSWLESWRAQTVDNSHYRLDRGSSEQKGDKLSSSSTINEILDFEQNSSIFQMNYSVIHSSNLSEIVHLVLHLLPQKSNRNLLKLNPAKQRLCIFHVVSRTQVTVVRIRISPLCKANYEIEPMRHCKTSPKMGID